jgi:hypothetical protein
MLPIAVPNSLRTPVPIANPISLDALPADLTDCVPLASLTDALRIALSPQQR